MGIDIAQYPIYDGATTVNCYVNIRNIIHDKNGDKYTLCGLAQFSTTTGIYVDSMKLSLEKDEIFVNCWDDLYTNLKVKLAEKGIAHVDVL